MKKFLHAVFLSGILTLNSFSQNTGALSFFVRDAENGYGTKAEIFIGGNNETRSYMTDEGGHLLFNNIEGRYDITINSENHSMIKTYFNITPGATINVEALLDPKNKTKVEYKKLNHAIIEGYVIDFESGGAMVGVSVSMEGVVKAITDEKGFFSVISQEYSEMLSPSDKRVRKTFSFSTQGYVSYAVQDIFIAPTKISLKVALKKGAGEEIKKEFQHILDGTEKDVELYEKNIPSESNQKSNPGGIAVMACSLPTTIRVGTGCACTNCSGVTVMSLQYYSESGLDDEWIASWNFASLAAGSVPYRSYGGWYVNNPVNANYDIANTTCNQVWGSVVYASTQSAAQSTAGDALTANGVNPARSEYSAQNNFGGTSLNCTDCNAGGSGAYSCYSDNICCGKSPAGHGRGMCQWGTQYWAQNAQSSQWMINHYYIATVGYSLCSSLNNSPAALSVQQTTCPHNSVTLQWANSGAGWFVDVTDDVTWTNFYNKAVPNVTSVGCPGGFANIFNPAVYLAFQPGTTYYWRVWDGSAHTYGNSFMTPSCIYNYQACSGIFDDTGGPGNSYNGNEDYVTVIQPNNAASVNITFNSFDLELNYDSLWIYNGGNTSAPLLGVYTGTNGPGTLAANSGAMAIRFKADPYMNNSGWTSTWNCVLTTDLNEGTINDASIKIYPNPSQGIFNFVFTKELKQPDIEVYNALGQKAAMVTTRQGSYYQIDLSSQPNGVYFISFKSESGTTRRKLIIDK